MTPNEARLEFNLIPLEGGDTVYLQQQQFGLASLAKRDALPNPFVVDQPVSQPTPTVEDPAAVEDEPPTDATKAIDHQQVADFTRELFAMITREAELEHG